MKINKGMIGIATTAIIAVVSMFFIGSIILSHFSTAPNNYIIEGNKVYFNDTNVYIGVEPHTVHDPQWIYVNVTSKIFTGNIDFAILTDTSTIDFTKIELYNPSVTATNLSYTCDADYFNYTVSPKHAWCWYNRTENTGTNATPVFVSTPFSLTFNHSFEVGSIPLKTIWWSESKENLYSVFPATITTQAINWNGLNKAYIAANLPVNAGTNYQVRIWAEPKINTAGKYWMAFKRSSLTIQQAIDGNELYYIDPWWNSSYNYVLTNQENQTQPFLGGNDEDYGGDGNFNRPRHTFIFNVSQMIYNDSANAKWGFDTASLITAGKLDSACGGLRVLNATNQTQNYEVVNCNSATTVILYSPNYNTTNANSTDQRFRLTYGDVENVSAEVFGSVYPNAGVKKVNVIYNFNRTGPQSVINDSSVNRRNTTFATDTGSGKLNTSGILGAAYYVDASGTTVTATIPVTVWNDIMNNFTASAWFKQDKNTGDLMLMSKWVSGGFNNLDMMIGDLGDGNVKCAVYTSSYVETASTTKPPAVNRWHHMACVYDGATLKTYLDGGLIGTASVTGNVRKDVDLMNIGVQNANNNEFEGLIDEIMIYNYSLSAEEINATYISTINYLVGAEETQPAASVVNNLFNTTTFTDRFTYTTAQDVGFTGNWSFGNITDANADYAISIVNNQLRLNVTSKTSTTTRNSAWVTLNGSMGRINNGIIEFNMLNISVSPSGDGPWAGIVFRQMANGTGATLFWDFTQNPDKLRFNVTTENAWNYNMSYGNMVNAGSGEINTGVDIQNNDFSSNITIKIIVNETRYKIFYSSGVDESNRDPKLYLDFTTNLINGSDNGTVSLFVMADSDVAVSSLNLSFDNFAIKQELQPTLSNFTVNSTNATIANFSVISTELAHGSSLCLLQLNNVNRTMTRGSGDLFSFTTTAISGSNTYIFWCNNTGNNFTTSNTFEYSSSGNNAIFYSANVTAPVNYNATNLTQFNITIENNNGTVYLETNITGAFANYTMSNNTSPTNYFFQAIVPSGAFSGKIYTWSNIGAVLNNSGYVSGFNFSIGRSTPSLSVNFNMTTPQAYGNIILVTGNISSVGGDQSATLVLQENATTVSSGVGNRTNGELLPRGNWTYNLTYQQTQNFSAGSNNGTIFVDYPAVLTGNLYINLTQASQTWTYPNATNATATIGSRLNNEGTLYLMRNLTSVGILSGFNFAMNESLLGSSIYNFTAAWVGYNYTFTNISYDLTINKAPPVINIYLNYSYATGNNTNLTYPNATMVNGTVIRFLGNFNASLFRNNTIITGMINENLTLAAGLWNYTAWWAGDENYTANQTQLNLTILSDSSPPFFSNFNINNTEIDLDLNESIELSVQVNEPSLSQNYTIFGILFPNGTSYNYTATRHAATNIFNLTYKFNFTSASQIGQVNTTVYANDSSGNTNSTSFTIRIQTSKINTTVILYSANYTARTSKFIIGSNREYIDNYFNVSVIFNASGTANITKRMNITLLSTLLANGSGTGQYSNFTLANGTSSSQGYNLINNHINYSLPFNQTQSRINDLSVFVARVFNFSTYSDNIGDLYYFNASNISNSTPTWLYISFPLNNSYNPQTTNALIELCESRIVWNTSYPVCNSTWSATFTLSQSNPISNAIGSRIFNFEYENSVDTRNMTFNASFSEFLLRVRYASGSQQGGGGGGGGGGATTTTTTLPLLAAAGEPLDLGQSPVAKLYLYFIGGSIVLWLYMSGQKKKRAKPKSDLFDLKI